MARPNDSSGDEWAIARIVEEKAAAAEADRRARIKEAARAARRALFVQLGWDADRIEAILRDSPGGVEYPRAREMQQAVDEMDEFFEDIVRRLVSTGLVPDDAAKAGRPRDSSG